MKILIVDDKAENLYLHREAFRGLTERVMRGESGILEFRIVALKGARRWLETHASPLRDASGNVTALLGITRDITARKQAEEKNTAQLAELRLWYGVTLGREDRVMALKDEVDELLRAAGKSPRYTRRESVEDAPQT